MVFEVPASQASIKQNVFEFQLPGEKKRYALPKLEFLNSDIRRRLIASSRTLKAVIEAGGEISQEQADELGEIQAEIIEAYCPGLYRKVTDDQINAILAAWQAVSAVTLGESSASVDS